MGFGGAEGCEAPWVPAEGPDWCLGAPGRAGCQQMPLQNVPLLLLLCSQRASLASLSWGCLQPCPPSPSLLHIPLCPTSPAPHPAAFQPLLCSPGVLGVKKEARAPPARGSCLETPAPGFGAWVGKGSIMGRRAGSRIIQRQFVLCPLGGRLSPLPQISSHVTSWEALKCVSQQCSQRD